MRYLWPLAVGAVLICSVTAAYAAPSFLGDTGVILTPNALTAPRHSATPQWHSMPGEIGKNGDNDNWDSIGSLFGLTDRLEVYLGYFTYDKKGEANDEFTGHFKAQGLREPDDWLNLAIGVRNIGQQEPSGKREPTAYVVGTKTVMGSEEEDNYLRLSAGLQFFNKDDAVSKEIYGDGTEDDTLFGSAEWRICRRAALMAEIMGAAKKDGDLLNFGARLNPWDDVTVDLFLIDDEKANEYELAFGASYVASLGSDENHATVPSRKSSHHAASPSLFGDTGIILMPNAITAPRHSVTPMYHGLAGGIGSDDGDKVGDVSGVESYGALVGGTDRLEVWVGSLSYEDEPFDSDGMRERNFMVHTKLQALREPDNCMNLAVGVRNYDLDGDHKPRTEPSAYIAATKTLFDAEDEDNPSYFRTTVGLQIANNEGFLPTQIFPSQSDGDKKGYTDSSLYGGVEWQLGRYFTLLGEVIEVAADDAAFNWGFRVHPSENFGLDVFFVEDVEMSEHEFAWGGSYRIDF